MLFISKKSIALGIAVEILFIVGFSDPDEHRDCIENQEKD